MAASKFDDDKQRLADLTAANQEAAGLIGLVREGEKRVNDALRDHGLGSSEFAAATTESNRRIGEASEKARELRGFLQGQSNDFAVSIDQALENAGL